MMIGAPEPDFGIDELCTLTGVSRRTVRFYTQKGLLDPPEGERRGAYYTRRHLEQLLAIRRWQAAGISLERISHLLRGDDTALPPVPPGTVEVWSRVMLRPGLELHLEPSRLGLTPDTVQALIQRLITVIDQD